MVAGVLLALSSATAFGFTLPVLAWAGVGVGAATTAALLYLGACLASLAQKPFVDDPGAALTRRELPGLLVMSLAGAAVAPTLLAWGLQRAGPVTGGLLLNLEAVWTAVLAWLVFREHLGGRVLTALALMTAGGVVLSLREGSGVGGNALGALSVMGATVAWAVDNTASRRLAESRPLTVVAAKGALGAALTSSLALVRGEPWPEAWKLVALLLAGATGYGFSLRLYLLAQRKMGAARTASVFSLAPFIGAALGLLVAPAPLGWLSVVSAVLFAAGVALHVFERHAHPHHHHATLHEHPHRHDDGHHEHPHASAVDGEHSHPHAHHELEHSHEHGDDLHHGHSH
jgi:drug/metabolite transporter (DMT)-like permease